MQLEDTKSGKIMNNLLSASNKNFQSFCAYRWDKIRNFGPHIQDYQQTAEFRGRSWMGK